ncbi:MAG: NADP-dependent malic enzyme, partial [Rhodoferax sp.]|nr:NADP-dependent malic enzyme [Actinomycetota bacterium]
AIAPVFAGINLEDISAPRCFEIEQRLRDELDIPVFHDDQHGTAILTLLLHAGAHDVVVCDKDGVVEPARPDVAGDPTSALGRVATSTNPRGVTGTLRGALAGADVFIGVSAPGILTGDDIATMGTGAVVFAMANPDPEVDPIAAAAHATVVATGRSDFANQINNVLAFPGVFRGLLDAQSRSIGVEVLLAAARALAAVVSDDELNAAYIIPSVFHPDVTKVVAAAVERAATGSRDPQ